jgi:oligopeptide/dipeptide ABC transporter ATP-binding protein
MTAILTVEGLKTQFRTMGGIVKAVDGVDMHINEREIIGVVGESGCGKSVTMLSVMQLIANPPGKVMAGKVLFDGKDLLQFEANGSEMRSYRGGKIAMIFQEPMTSLNPTLTINQQISEMLELHLGMNKQDSRKRSGELLKLVGVPEAETRLEDYPHQFSGGMRQRAMIAMALSCNPKILIADEPTTALDVTTQAQILGIMQDMVNKLGTSLVIVTHNLGVVARYAQRIYIMYAGRIVESGTAEDIFLHPRHPYTIGLLNCVPRLDEELGRKLVPIKGMPPNLIFMPPNCAFLPRCDHATDRCRKELWPALREVGNQHHISCYVDVQEKS